MEIRNFKITIFSFVFSFLFFTSVYAETQDIDYRLNEKEENARLNPYVVGNKIKIEINSNRGQIKFKDIDICPAIIEDVLKCDKDTRVKHYYTTTEVPSITRDWNGKTSKDVIVADGDYKIKVTIGEELPQWLSPHIITIDSNFSGGSGGSSSSSSQNSSSQSQSASSPGVASVETSPSFISTHSSAEELSELSKSSTRFEASSGRDRLAYSGAPIAFDGEVSVPKDSYGQSVKFVWSFGDGSVAEGKKVSHAYKFAGDYIVVLNASLPDLSAVSRTSVKVVSPSVVISNVSGDSVEVWNKGTFEINLNGWLISNDRGKFIFPLDTIITSNKKIAFPDEYMKLNLAQGGKVSLLNPSQKEVSSHLGVLTDVSTTQVSQGASPNLDNDPVVMKIRDFIAKANKASAENGIVENKIPVKTDDKLLTKKEKNLTATVIVNDNKTISSSTQTATVISNSSNDSRQVGFLKNIFSLPSSGFNFIREKFYSGD